MCPGEGRVKACVLACRGGTPVHRIATDGHLELARGHPSLGPKRACTRPRRVALRGACRGLGMGWGWALRSTPFVVAPSATTPTGSHRSQMRHRANMSKERARASAHHMRQVQHKPATTTP